MAVLVLMFEVDLKKHFLDVCHNTDAMVSEPDKNMSEVWLKSWTFTERGVERLPIMRFGAADEQDSTLRGSSIFSKYTVVREVSYLDCFVIFFTYRPSFNVCAHCFTIHSYLLRILCKSSQLFFQSKQVFGKLAHSCLRVADDLSFKEDQLHIVHHQTDRNC